MGMLRQLRQQVVDRLQADSYFEDMPVLVEDKGDLDNEIARALGALTETGGKVGCCVVVMSPRADVKNPNVSKPVLDPIVITIHVEEAVLINQSTQGTQKHCSDVAERVAALLHWWTPDGRQSPLLAGAGALQAVEPVIGDVAYAAILRATGGLSVTLSQVATPTSSPDGGATPATVTLACATAGAAIFYTLDGKHPSPTAGTLCPTRTSNGRESLLSPAAPQR
jgi:hypothetical protein